MTEPPRKTVWKALKKLKLKLPYGWGWALRVEERGRPPTPPSPLGRLEGVGTTNPGVPGAGTSARWAAVG